MNPGSKRVERLLGNVDWAMRHGLDRGELIPMVERLLAAADPDSPVALYAKRHLARLIVERSPWRAASLARDVLRHAEDAQAWAVLGLAYTLLGHYHCAKQAYFRALAVSPDCAWSLHNLGHLLDVALGRPHSGLYYLRSAYLLEPDVKEIAASYAHALGRSGHVEHARRVLSRALRCRKRAERLLSSWLAPGAPALGTAAQG